MPSRRLSHAVQPGSSLDFAWWLLAIATLVALVLIPGCDPPASGDEQAASAVAIETDEVESHEAPDEAADREPAEPSVDEPPPELLDPSATTDQAPDEFQIEVETTQGEFTIAVYRDWAPHGADRLYNLVQLGYFEDIAFFRVIDGFMAQFGIHGDPAVNEVWRHANIPDDEVIRSNTRGKVTFATSGPDSRSTQLFINFDDNANLDGMGFAPVGKVIEGMDVVDALHDGYGEGAPRGRGPAQDRIQRQGNTYLREAFEDLDYLISATIADD